MTCIITLIVEHLREELRELRSSTALVSKIKAKCNNVYMLKLQLHVIKIILAKTTIL